MRDFRRFLKPSDRSLRPALRPGARSTRPAAEGGSPAINFRQWLSCPVLSDAVLQQLEDSEPEFITRHIDQRWLDLACGGQFRFGTIHGYLPKDKALIKGRLGDLEEGSQREVINSQSGHFSRVQMGETLVENVYTADNPIAYTYLVNAYCSCSTIGPFDATRATALRKMGNPELNAYVTYDLAKLKNALRMLLSESSDSHLRLFGRPVDYGPKNRRWEIEGQYEHKEERSPLDIFLAVAFVKSELYRHENEYRMLIVDPQSAAILPESTPPLERTDPRIAEAIADIGTF